MSASLAITTITDAGLVRVENQDSLFVDSTLGVFAVADGMGGGAEGARASRTACASIMRSLKSGGDFKSRTQSVVEAISAANDDILAYASAHGYSQMGTTLVSLVFDDSRRRAAVINIGDSRLYRIRGAKAELLTHDHTVGAEMASRSIFADQLSKRTNPLAHVLTRVIGMSKAAAPDVVEFDVRGGDRFLLCSDGVHDLVGTDALGDLLGFAPRDAAAKRLAHEVMRLGAHDNYTIVIVDVAGSPADDAIARLKSPAIAIPRAGILNSTPRR